MKIREIKQNKNMENVKYDKAHILDNTSDNYQENLLKDILSHDKKDE